MQSIIDDEKDIPLSGTEVLKLVDYKSKVIRYPDLHKYGTLDDCLSPHGSFFLLYESQPAYGHWTSVTLHQGVITYFDSYGKKYDTMLAEIEPRWRRESHQDFPYLTTLFNNAPYTITYNKTPFQKYGKGIKTCGRWAGIRILFKDLSNEDFTYLFKNKDSDDLISYLTMIKNKKI